MEGAFRGAPWARTTSNRCERMYRYHDIRNRPPHTPLNRASVMGKKIRQGSALTQRARGNGRNEQSPFVPPEDWHEPTGAGGRDFKVVVQHPGRGYRHIVTEQEVRERLDQLPDTMLAPLEVLQFSRITRKKQSFPCYGMQWGPALYLYPIEESLIEFFASPPSPAQFNEARMFGGIWEEVPPHSWRLKWSESAIQDFYLNNILIHELGHLLDDRNTSYTDRERYAEWFAIEHGYRRTRNTQKKRVSRRHHSS